MLVDRYLYIVEKVPISNVTYFCDFLLSRAGTFKRVIQSLNGWNPSYHLLFTQSSKLLNGIFLEIISPYYRTATQNITHTSITIVHQTSTSTTRFLYAGDFFLSQENSFIMTPYYNGKLCIPFYHLSTSCILIYIYISS